MTFLPEANSAFSQVQGAGARSGNGDDPVRSMLRELVQEAITLKLQAFMSAGKCQRSGERRGWRNGSKPRRFKTRVGTLELRIPKDRDGRFQPSLFERYQRSEKAFVLALIEMYLEGVSTRRVTKVVEELCGASVSASQVSSLVKKFTEREAWRTRSLAGTRYPYLIVDAHYEKVRINGRVRSTAVLWVIGVSEEGYREHLGVWLGAGESAEGWSRVFRDLVQRGLEGVSYIVSDEHLGLRQALERYFPAAEHQRCQVHYLRNAFAMASTEELAELLKSGLRDAWSAPERTEAQARTARLIDRVRERNPRVADWLEETVDATLCFYTLKAAESPAPPAHDQQRGTRSRRSAPPDQRDSRIPE